jgi:tetratricopeptide (TPR) repeat protein
MLPTLVLLVLLQNPLSNFEQSFRSGLLALERGDLVTARKDLEAASHVAPDDARISLALAQTYQKLHESAAAQAAAERAEKLGLNNPAVLQGLVVFYSGAGQHKAAIEAVHRIEGWTSNAGLRNLLGKEYALDGQFDAAATELREALKLRPYDEAFIFDAANLDLRLERFDAAMEVLNQGRKNFDKSPQLEIALGVAYYGLRRFPEAIDQFLKTIALAPDLEQPYIFLGKMLDHAGERLPEITARFIRYEQVEDESYLGYLLHAKALRAAAGDAIQINALLKKAALLDARQWETHFELALSLEAKPNLDGAAKELETAIQLNPKEPLLHYRLARVYDRLGKSDLARAERELHEALSPKGQRP